MKKLILSAAIFCSSYAVNAQTAQFGIIAGANFNSIKLSSAGDKTLGSGVAYHAGVTARFQLAPSFAIQPALLISRRGGEWGVSSDIETNLLGLQLPVHFLYTEKNFFAGAGPSVTYGLKARFEGDGLSVNAYKETEPSYKLKRLEVGASLVAGYKLKNGLYFSASFNPSFTDLSEEFEITANTVGISVGFFFQKRK